jgi:hypothetical protein
MRFMNIPPLPNCSEITDLRSFYETRLATGRYSIGPTGLRLLGYMGWPNDLAERDNAISVIGERSEYYRGAAPLVSRLRTIQKHWIRVADIIQLYYDLAEGRHQERRGGPSIGKAIHLASKNSESNGTGEAQLWKIWKTYKDVAPTVTAAVIVAADLKERHKRIPLDLTLSKILPLRVTLLMPELIIGLGQTIEQYGLQEREDAGPLFDHETLWRILPDTGVAPLPMPRRVLRPIDVQILNDRRAGNRGRHHRHSETTPIP